MHWGRKTGFYWQLQKLPVKTEISLNLLPTWMKVKSFLVTDGNAFMESDDENVSSTVSFLSAVLVTFRYELMDKEKRLCLSDRSWVQSSFRADDVELRSLSWNSKLQPTIRCVHSSIYLKIIQKQNNFVHNCIHQLCNSSFMVFFYLLHASCSGN